MLFPPNPRQLNLLEMVPRPCVQWEETNDRRVTLLMPRFGSGRLGRWLEERLHPNPVRIKLDEIGSATWQFVDGSRTVGEIGEALQTQFGATVEPIYDRLAIFFKHLERQNLIALAPQG